MKIDVTALRVANMIFAVVLVALHGYLFYVGDPMPFWYLVGSYFVVGAITGRLYAQFWRPENYTEHMCFWVGTFGWWVIWYFAVAGFLMWFFGTLLRFAGCCLYGLKAFEEAKYKWEPEWLRAFMQRQLTNHYLRRINKEHGLPTKPHLAQYAQAIGGVAIVVVAALVLSSCRYGPPL